MNRIIATVAMCFSVVLHASVPEPSFVIQGNVKNGNTIVESPLLISAEYQGKILSDVRLSGANSYIYTLEIPLEANKGDVLADNKARVGGKVHILVDGEASNATVDINGRGMFVTVDVELPDLLDSDGDGISDKLDPFPNDPNKPVRFGNKDLDGDGISNASESHTGSYNPHGDADGDGYSNEEEYANNTDPTIASSLPAQTPPEGQYSALHVHSNAMQYLQAQTGGPLTWDEAAWGVPTSIQAVYWDEDQKIDYLVATTKGAVYILKQVDANAYAAPDIIDLFSLSTTEAVTLGFANTDGKHAPELWAFSGNNLYLYQRSADYADREVHPYGDIHWQILDLSPDIDSVQMIDLDGDNIADLIASGVNMDATDMTPEQTLVFYKGIWDGVTYSLADTPIYITAQTHISANNFHVINNVGEVGFDAKPDILVRDAQQKYTVNLSYNSLRRGAIAESLGLQVVTAPSANDTSTLTAQEAEIDTAAYQDVWTEANLDGDVNNTKDLLQYTGALDDGTGYQFRIVPGIKNTKETDGDGIVDYKDIAVENADLPLPKGNVDFDGDSTPYGVDPTHSGKEDFDSDGMIDSFELMNGLNPGDDADAISDEDGDGVNAFQEFMDGTDPFDPNSVITQQASMLSSVKAFEMGASDMLLRGDDVIVASQNDTAVKIFDVSTMQEIRTLRSSDNNGVAKIISTDNLMVMGNVGGTIEVWDSEKSIRMMTFERSQSTITDMATEGVYLYSLHASGEVYQWNLQTLTYVAHWQIYDGFLTSLHVKDDLLYIQAANPEKIMFVWNTKTREQVYTISGDAECCERVIAEPVGDKLIIANSLGGGDGIYSMSVGNLTSTEIVSGLTATAMRANNNDLYVGRKSGVIDKYSLVDGSFQGRVVAPYTYVRDIEMRDGGFLSLHSDGQIYLWEYK